MMSCVDLEATMCDFADQIEQVIAVDDWESLNSLLSQRQQALEHFFTHVDKKPPQSLEIIALIQTIQQQDKHFFTQLEAKKATTETQYLSLKQGRKSIKAYQAE